MKTAEKNWFFVAILVLVDYPFGVSFLNVNRDTILSRNPCSSGLSFRRLEELNAREGGDT